MASSYPVIRLRARIAAARSSNTMQRAVMVSVLAAGRSSKRTRSSLKSLLGRHPMAPLWYKDRSLGRVPVRPHTILHAFTQQTDSSQLTPGWEVLTEIEVQASRVNKQFRMVSGFETHNRDRLGL